MSRCSVICSEAIQRYSIIRLVLVLCYLSPFQIVFEIECCFSTLQYALNLLHFEWPRASLSLEHSSCGGHEILHFFLLCKTNVTTVVRLQYSKLLHFTHFDFYRSSKVHIWFRRTVTGLLSGCTVICTRHSGALLVGVQCLAVSQVPM